MCMGLPFLLSFLEFFFQVSYYVILGGLQAMCMGLSNVSVQYLSYPTHILFKVQKTKKVNI